MISHVKFFLQIFNWIPEYYNDTKSLPEKMPLHLKERIKDIESRNRREVGIRYNILCHEYLF